MQWKPKFRSLATNLRTRMTDMESKMQKALVFGINILGSPVIFPKVVLTYMSNYVGMILRIGQNGFQLLETNAILLHMYIQTPEGGSTGDS